MTLYKIDYDEGVAGQILPSGTGLPMPGPGNMDQPGTVTYDATHVAHGAMATKHSPADSNVSWVAYGNNSNLSFDSTGLAVRGYFYFTNTPGFAFLTVYDTAMASVAWLGINSSGYLFIRDAATNPLVLGTVPITVNRWLRAELYVTTGTSGATVSGALYDGDSTTPIDILTSSSAVTTGALLDAVWIGKNNYNSNPADHWVDSVAIDTAATGFIGPFGSEASQTPFHVWDGSAYVPVEMRRWNGSSYESVTDA